MHMENYLHHFLFGCIPPYNNFSYITKKLRIYNISLNSYNKICKKKMK